MKLSFRILSRLSLCFLVITGIWCIAFYAEIIDEIRDETDDCLENYARRIIAMKRAGHEFSQSPSADNSSYSLQEVTEAYALAHPRTLFIDEMMYVEEEQENEPTRTLKTTFKDTDGRHYELTVSLLTIEKEDLQESILYSVALLYLSLLAASILINFVVFRHEMKPLYVLLKWIKTYTIGQNKPLPETKTNITEFKELYRAMNSTTQKNEEIFEQQKQFISNAAHELQTPLAVCKNRLELLAERETIEEKELTEIMSVQETLEHIIRLNRSLLFLSKIENGQFPETTKICFNDLIKTIAAGFREAYEYRRIDFRIEEKGVFDAIMNELLATSLVTNLLKNAFLHNCENGRIDIEILRDEILFSNTGEAEALNKDFIFKRFYQSKNKKEKSTGLGLAIAHSICRYCRLHLQYDYRDGEHRFRVTKTA
ncbi:MAG: HAMP domain-containing histidine kinase [Bacteroidales bacterium]|jgi:signal transduction histidine kinase|nr:HAMP domain-containing histidine kinase [Bacteroidales bacterium]